MKEIKVMREVEIWEAADGKQFDNQEECERYESTVMYKIMKDEWENQWLTHQLGIYCLDDCDAYLVRFENEEDFNRFDKLRDEIGEGYPHCDSLPVPDAYPCSRIYWVDNCNSGFISYYGDVGYDGDKIIRKYISQLSMAVCKMQSWLDEVKQ